MNTPSSTSDWPAMHRRFRPEAEALFDVGTGRRWTWAQLDDEASAWAARLRQEGVEPGDRVGVLALNRGETFALAFAVAKLGAVLFPMNWRLAPDELQWQLDNCTPRLVVVDGRHAELALGVPTLLMDEGPGTLPTGAPFPGSALGAPWMIMYTSGSTGRPKGALLTHQMLQYNAMNTVLACDLDTTSATLTFTPLFHTGGMNCLSLPLFFRGGRVVLTPTLDPAEALQLVVDERISHLMGVPTIYQMLADQPAFDTADLGCVRDALCGGAPLALPLLERYQARGIPLRQGFGMTEVGPNCFSMPGERALEKMRGGTHPSEGPPGSCVGLPIHLIDMKLVDAAGAEVPEGEPGELLLKGPVVCGGYWNNPEATAKSIRDGWFHTGDVLSRDHEGYFHVRGRLKEMFISGGENVYPAEVEAALQRHADVALAAVVGIPDERWGEVGRAFVETHPGRSVEAAALKAFLQERLARFKVPKIYDIVPTDALPRTASGKLDKTALARRPLP
jgi:fatty-acyl-CoA synthase